jgi:hypothetical protein
MIISCESRQHSLTSSVILTHKQQYRSSPFQAAEIAIYDVLVLYLGIKSFQALVAGMFSRRNFQGTAKKASMRASIFRIYLRQTGLPVLDNVQSLCILYQDTYSSSSLLQNRGNWYSACHCQIEYDTRTS